MAEFPSNEEIKAKWRERQRQIEQEYANAGYVRVGDKYVNKNESRLSDLSVESAELGNQAARQELEGGDDELLNTLIQAIIEKQFGGQVPDMGEYSSYTPEQLEALNALQEEDQPTEVPKTTGQYLGDTAKGILGGTAKSMIAQTAPGKAYQKVSEKVSPYVSLYKFLKRLS